MMGTGSFGGFGGGGGSGTGGFRSGAGGYVSRNGAIKAATIAREQMRAEVRAVLKAMPREYVVRYCASPFTQAAFEEMFWLRVELQENQRWDNLHERFGIDGGPGCLFRFAGAIYRIFAPSEPDQRVRESASTSLEDFLLRLVRDDIDVFLHGDAKAVLENLDPAVFKTTSGHFLMFLFWRMLERESERLPPESELQLRDIAQEIADRVIGKFEVRHLGKPYGDRAQTTYRDLLRVLANEEWFRMELGA
jgi:hypothetical protein